MKKVFLLLLLLFVPTMVFAKEYEVKDVDFKVNIPDNYMVITRDNLENNAQLSSLGISAEKMKSIMSSGNIYMDIIENNVKYEILLVIPDIKIEINNLSNFNGKLLDETKDAYAKKVGIEKADIYKAKHNFIKVDYYDDKTGYYIVNYYTVVNAKGYNFQMQKLTAITEEEKNELKEIVDTIEIKVKDEYKNESKEVEDAINKESKSAFNWGRVLIYTVIGGVVGGASSLIGLLIKKRNKTGV